MSILLALENGEIGLLDSNTQRLQKTGITIKDKVFHREGEERHEFSLLTSEQIEERQDEIDADTKREVYFIVPNTPTAGLITKNTAYVGTQHGEIHRYGRDSGITDVTSRLNSFTAEEKKWDLYGNKGHYEKHIENTASWQRHAEKHSDNSELQDIVKHQKEDDAKRTGRYFDLSNVFFNGWWRLDKILEVGDQVWDFSMAGIFHTDTNKLLRDTEVRSPQFYDGQVIGAFKKHGLRSYLDSSLGRPIDQYVESDTDLKTMDGITLMKKAAMHNGSGCEQGKITVVDGLIFRYHDYHTLDVHDLTGGKFRGKISLQDPMNAQVLQDGRDLYLAASEHKTGLHYMNIRGGEIKLEPVEGLMGVHLSGFNTPGGLLLAECGYHDSTTKLHTVEDGQLQGTIELPYKARVLDVRE